MEFPYSTRYYPSVPATEITVRLPESNSSVGPLPALIDTGADGTVVPTGYLKSLNLTAVDWVLLRGQWDEGHRTRSYLVDMRIAGIWLLDIEIVEEQHGQDIYILLGRNVLNRLKLLLDGPEETTEIL